MAQHQGAHPPSRSARTFTAIPSSPISPKCRTASSPAAPAPQIRLHQFHHRLPALRFSPDQLRFVMIDPKVVELQQYNACPPRRAGRDRSQKSAARIALGRERNGKALPDFWRASMSATSRRQTRARRTSRLHRLNRNCRSPPSAKKSNRARMALPWKWTSRSSSRAMKTSSFRKTFLYRRHRGRTAT